MNFSQWNSFDANLKRFKAAGAQLYFTEIDVRIKIDDGLTTAELQHQKAVFTRLIQLAKKYGVKLVAFHGLHDHNWIPSHFPGFGAACL